MMQWQEQKLLTNQLFNPIIKMPVEFKKSKIWWHYTIHCILLNLLLTNATLCDIIITYANQIT